MSPISIKVLKGKKGFYELENDWNRIVSMLEGKRLFHIYEWYKSYIETLDGDRNLFFIVMERDGVPVAIFPLEKSMISILKLKLNVLQIPRCRDAGFGDFIFEQKEDNAHLIEMLVSGLKKHIGRNWYCIIFPNVFEDSSLYYSLKNTNRLLMMVKQKPGCFFLPCESYDKIYKNISRNFKSNLNQTRNRLARLNNVTYQTVRDSKDMPWAFQEFIDLEASGWKLDSGTPIKKYKEVAEFYRNLILNFSEKGDAEIKFIRVNKEIIAAALCLVANDTFYVVKVAYNEDYSYERPGIALFNELIRECSNNPSIRNVNVLSHSAWVGKWNPSVLDLFDVFIFRKNLFGILYRILIEFGLKGKMFKEYLREKIRSKNNKSRLR